MADLPADVITDILSRLPVMSLLQFRSVSKSWRSLIDSHNFKTLHLHNLNSDLNLILRHISQFYSVDFPTLGTVNLNRPLKSYRGNDITVLGSCNGLLCIRIADDIAIWNPYLCKQWILPYLSRSYDVCDFGFGFDSFTGDYKLVKISCFWDARSTLEFKVILFSCNANAWITLTNIPYALSGLHRANGVFVDHALHWIATRSCGRRSIVAFDLKFEVFNEVPLPELGKNFVIELSHLGGDLSMAVNYRNTDIWVMKQYGSKDSWFKLFTLFECPVLSSLKFVKPLAYSNDGMKVLFEQDVDKWMGSSNRLFWYNLKTKQVSYATNPGLPYFDEAMIWVGTLVQPLFPCEMQK